jgi:short-subunit dehydrogenase
MKWDGSVAVITGASRGIGRATAVRAAKAGARVGLIARAKDELEQVLAECGGRGAIAVADVSDRDAVTGAIEALAGELGPVDILVANAGVGAFGKIADTDVEVFEHLMRVNYLGKVYAIKAVLPSMLERGRGHIVTLSSIAGRIGAPLEGAYSASKFAVDGLSESLGFELAPRGIGVSVIYPGPVETSFFEARGAPYARKSPKPVPADRVARDIIRAVERGRAETLIPRWLRFPVVIKALMPGAFRAGTLRTFRNDLR